MSCPVWQTDGAIAIQIRLVAALEAWPKMRPKGLRFASDTLQEVYDRGADQILQSKDWKDYESIIIRLIGVWESSMTPACVPFLISTVRWQMLMKSKYLRAVEEARTAYNGRRVTVGNH